MKTDSDTNKVQHTFRQPTPKEMETTRRKEVEIFRRKNPSSDPVDMKVYVTDDNRVLPGELVREAVARTQPTRYGRVLRMNEKTIRRAFREGVDTVCEQPGPFGRYCIDLDADLPDDEFYWT